MKHAVGNMHVDSSMRVPLGLIEKFRSTLREMFCRAAMLRTDRKESGLI